jgi:hypothetical protein
MMIGQILPISIVRSGRRVNYVAGSDGLIWVGSDQLNASFESPIGVRSIPRATRSELRSGTPLKLLRLLEEHLCPTHAG